MNTSPNLQLWLPQDTDTLEVSKLTENFSKIDAFFASEGSIPAGCILIWSGAVNTIPSGWALCDGTNGTPDLRDKFVLGAGNSYNVGATGGEAAHTLTVSEMPNHSHQVVVYTVASGSNSGIRKLSNESNSTNVSTGSTGGNAAHNNMPPYYALCYIMKL